MKLSKSQYVFFMAFIVFCFTLPASVQSQPFQRHTGQRIVPPRVVQNLNSEQKDELLSMISEMRESGAEREEIGEAVRARLTEWGIELSEREPGQRGMLPRGFMQQLDADQKAELKALVDEMRESGAGREEIGEAVRARLTEWGIELPERQPGQRGMLPHGLLRQLDADQKAELKALVSEMRESGAEREEIGEAVRARLTEWGIELPERQPGQRGMLPRGFMRQLDADQKAELKTLVAEMREAGKSRKEIRHAVRRKIGEWQIELPDNEEKDQATGSEPAGLRLQNYPNPFNPETNITYTLEQQDQVSLAIYNAQGQLVRTLVNEIQAPGQYIVRWDGMDQDGERVSSGLYFYRMQAGENIENDTMIMLK
ncbi:T9SS type A sorting domain-containing protein [candidate division KSB1 bacterium]|nr:T9SS type A sorting domain-containing protein [candidate division KSB1 bacterium]